MDGDQPGSAFLIGCVFLPELLRQAALLQQRANEGVDCDADGQGEHIPGHDGQEPEHDEGEEVKRVAGVTVKTAGGEAFFAGWSFREERSQSAETEQAVLKEGGNETNTGDKLEDQGEVVPRRADAVKGLIREEEDGTKVGDGEDGGNQGKEKAVMAGKDAAKHAGSQVLDAVRSQYGVQHAVCSTDQQDPPKTRLSQ